ncbi:MAG TPA: MFS transporter [Gammaproteobacteria bacterium]|nr:MFS transporter [Gammaproteobacteria bacterium]
MTDSSKQRALRFVVGLGIVSLFADFTYEGGRSILGPYLATLGASSLFVGAVGGLGEFLGYLMRLFSGRFVDRTHRHWQVMAAGYAVNLLSVPLLALAGNPWFAGFLVFSERLGKGARVPPRDALLSRAGRELGHGFSFGLHEALDKTGAVLGPLLVAAAVAWSGYRLGFAVLAVPAFLALLFLLRARGVEPEATHKHAVAGDAHFDARYYLYLAFSVISVFGFAQYILVAYHLQVAHRLAPALIPVLYGLAMGVDALAALLGGRIFDRHGLKVLIVLPLLSLPAVPLLFLSGTPVCIWLGAVFWGAALGVQQSTVRAGVATLTPEHQRGTAYGLFDSAFGLALLLGSMLLGALYGHGAVWLVIAAMGFQVAALPLLFLVLRPRSKS